MEIYVCATILQPIRLLTYHAVLRPRRYYFSWPVHCIVCLGLQPYGSSSPLCLYKLCWFNQLSKTTIKYISITINECVHIHIVPNILDLNYTILRLAQQNPYTPPPLPTQYTRDLVPPSKNPLHRI